MIKTWYEEYEKIKDKAIVVFGYEWESMADEQKEKILAEKIVIMSVETFALGTEWRDRKSLYTQIKGGQYGSKRTGK